jgi:hypothetical protein
VYKCDSEIRMCGLTKAGVQNRVYPKRVTSVWIHTHTRTHNTHAHTHTHTYMDGIPVGARFSAPVQTGPAAHPASYTVDTGFFQGGKRPARGDDHPPPSRVFMAYSRVNYIYKIVNDCILAVRTEYLGYISSNNTTCCYNSDRNLEKHVVRMSVCWLRVTSSWWSW